MFNLFHGIHKGPLPPLTVGEIELREQLHRHIDMLSRVIGPRSLPGHPHNLELAAAYLETTLSDLGYAPRPRPFDVQGARVRNIDAQLDGISRPHEVILVGAHYDSVDLGRAGGCPAANDNATGVAAVLEIARYLRQRPQKLARSVRFAAFVNEEPPFFQTEMMGSLVYAKRCRAGDENIIAMLTPETIGCYSDAPRTQSYPFPLKMLFPDVGNFIAFVGNSESSKLVATVTKSFRGHTPFPAIGFAAPGWITQAGWSDHWSFWKCGYPALMATDTAPLRYRHYHTPQDTIDKLDFDKMARVVAGLVRVVVDLADASISH
jgi:hypothetical protein